MPAIPLSYSTELGRVVSQGGGKLLNFTYSTNLGELVGAWNADVAGGSFQAGAKFTVEGYMKNGLIEQVWKDPDGMIHLSGKDAGVYLMCSTPPAKEIAAGGTNEVIQDLVNFCGPDITCQISGVGLGSTGVNMRSAVTGTTCAEAILEMAMLGGQIAYIDKEGKLVVGPPAPGFSLPNIQLDYTGSQLDMEGYATQVSVVVTRRKKTKKEEIAEKPQGAEQKYRGSTPDAIITLKSDSGSFSHGSVSGSYTVSWYEPIKAIKHISTTITNGYTKVQTEEDHCYCDFLDNIEHKYVWRGNQEYLLFAWIEKSYEITKTVTGPYQDTDVDFKETTTEHMEREFTGFSTPWINDDWRNHLRAISKETIERNVLHERAKTQPDDKMPPFDPPFDFKLERTYDYKDSGRIVTCAETETKYEARQLGIIAPVKRKDGSTGLYSTISIFEDSRYLGLVSHTAPAWIPVKTYRSSYSKYRDDGSCVVSTQSEWCDDGAEWIVKNLPHTGDLAADEYQEDYAKFSPKISGLSVNVGGGGLQSEWQFLEIPGKVKTEAEEDNENQYAISSENWYFNGGYLPTKYCPHYEEKENDCSIYGISAISDFDGEECPYQGRSWQGCIRARAALEQARYEEDRPLLEAPVVGIKNGGDSVESKPKAGYNREFYIDDIIDESTAQALANAAAENIWNVKRRKGYRDTITIPLAQNYYPNGGIASVSHDLFNMKTTISYFTDGPIPDFAISSSVAGISDGISGRNSGRRTRPMNGTIVSITDSGTVNVNINGMVYPCTTKLINLSVGDAVLVSFASGNSMHGHIIERM